LTDPALPRFYENHATPLGLPAGSETVRRQASIVAKMAGAATGPLYVADMGCGDGIVTAAVIAACAATSGADARVVGFDWSATALGAAAGRGVVAARASATPPGLPLADASQDVVIMSELIEHLVDTDGALAEARRVLRPGGSLVLSTPNLAAWYNRALLAFGVQPVFSEVSLYGIYGRPGHEVAGHLRIFTKRALAGLLAAAGFIDVAMSGAPYHDVPRPLRPIDRLLCRFPGLASILVAVARTPG
jgi:SAM-dependent methyltransferase